MVSLEVFSRPSWVLQASALSAPEHECRRCIGPAEFHAGSASAWSSFWWLRSPSGRSSASWSKSHFSLAVQRLISYCLQSLCPVWSLGAQPCYGKHWSRMTLLIRQMYRCQKWGYLFNGLWYLCINSTSLANEATADACIISLQGKKRASGDNLTWRQIVR